MTFYIIWPERRTIDANRIETWYYDAVANGDAEHVGLRDVTKMAKELDNIGYITLGR